MHFTGEQRFDGDAAMLAEVVGVFRGSRPAMVRALSDAVARKDAAAIERAAHSIKGAVGNFAAAAAAKAAGRIEEMGREKKLAGAAKACSALEKELARLDEALAILVKAQAA